MGQDFRLQLFYMARLLSKKKKKGKNSQCLHSQSGFKPALQKSSSMDCKSEPLHQASKPSICTRHCPSYHNKHTEQLLTFQWEATGFRFFFKFYNGIFLASSTSQKSLFQLWLPKARHNAVIEKGQRKHTSFIYSSIIHLLNFSTTDDAVTPFIAPVLNQLFGKILVPWASSGSSKALTQGRMFQKHLRA